MKWMHLSDIHLNKYFNNVMSTILREELPIFIENNNLSVDYLFITGDYRDASYLRDNEPEDLDIAAKNVAEYILQIAKSLHVPNNHIYLVPGNHDLSRSKEAEEKIKEISKSYSTVRHTLKEDERSYLLSRFHFFDKVYGYVHPENKQIPSEDKQTNPAFHRYFSEEDFDLLCLNTALTCYGKEKKGELFLDSIAINEWIKNSEADRKSKPLFILAHHSLKFMTEEEQKNLEFIWKDRKVFYLCGHSHKLMFDYDDDQNKWEITVGTTKRADDAAPILAIGEVINFDSSFSLSFYKYDFDNKKRWVPYQELSSKNFVNKLGFVGKGSKISTREDYNIIQLPLQQATASSQTDQKKTIRILSEIKSEIITLYGKQSYLVSLMELPVNAAIMIGYALHKKGQIQLYYQSGNILYLNSPAGKILVFSESKSGEEDFTSAKELDLYIYIHAKSNSGGKSAFYDSIKNKNGQNIFSVLFENVEMYDEMVNLEKTASYLADKISEYYDYFRQKGLSCHVHLFYNGFIGLALLLGNQMPTTFPIMLYDYEVSDQSYHPSFQLKSNMFKIPK